MAKQDQVALVTGANKGIGRAVAAQLGAKGIVVYVGARDATRGEEAAKALRADKVDARFVRIDVTSAASIEAARAQLESEAGKLDILVNNAGISVEPSAQATLEGMHKVFETNFFGAVAVTMAFESLLTASKRGRVVNVSSSLGSLVRLQEEQLGLYKLLAYGASKTALNGVTVLLSDRLREKGIKINSACPGYCATDLNGRRGNRSPEEGARVVVQLATLDDKGATGGFFDDAGKVPW